MIVVPKDDLTKYATEDADNTLQIGLKIKKELEKEPELQRYFCLAVMPILSKALFHLEEIGVYVDPKQIEPTKKRINQKVEEYTKQALSFVPKRVLRDHEEKGLKLTRRDLVKDALFGKNGFGLKPKFFTKTRAPSTDAETRADLLSDVVPQNVRSFVEAYEDWSEWFQLKSKSLSQLVGAIRHDGRLHTSFNIVRPVTGRVASAGPNLMNIPKRTSTAEEVRKLVAAPEGYVLIESDESQSELRWMAHLSGDKEMLRVYRNNEDIHLNTARVLTKNYDKLLKKEQDRHRTDAKPANFGLLYGSSAEGFARRCRKDGIEMTKWRAEEIIDNWFSLYPMVAEYQDKTKWMCARDGYIVSPLGRKRRLPGIHSKNFSERGEAERQAVNHPIQSASSDTVLLALVEILKDKRIDPEECRPVLFVHDSIILECKEDKVDKYVPLIKWHLEHPPLEKLFGIKLRVPMVADAKVGPNLGEMKDYE
jgi:DNA polymerase-1